MKNAKLDRVFESPQKRNILLIAKNTGSNKLIEKNY
jgi:hypothetical protein